MQQLHDQTDYDAASIIQQFLNTALLVEGDAPQEESLVARFCGEVIDIFHAINTQLASIPATAMEEEETGNDRGLWDARISLERSCSRLRLWSDGYGVGAGRLDETFAKSQKLRRATLRILISVSETLYSRLPSVAHAILGNVSKAHNDRIQKLKILVEAARNDVDDDEDDDSSTDCSSEYDSDSLTDVAADLKVDTMCLMDLDPLFRNPILDPEREKSVSGIGKEAWVPHHPFSDRIEARFPKASESLISRLGKATLERYIRCRAERERKEHGDCIEEEAEDLLKLQSTVSSSKFGDSGLGTSIPSSASNAETIMSYHDGDRGRAARIPPLPLEAKAGKPFPCVACGKSVVIRSNRAWKRHLYEDLLPWQCLDLGCSSTEAFRSRKDWVLHMSHDHDHGPDWDVIMCPLCLDDIGPGVVEVTGHLGGHLEEISLGALPSGQPEDEESDHDHNDDYETSLQAAARTGNQSLLQELLDKGAYIDEEPGLDTALHAAAMHGHHGVVRLLLQKRADVDASFVQRSALQAASMSGHQEIVRLLLEKGALNNAPQGHGTAKKKLSLSDYTPKERSATTPVLPLDTTSTQSQKRHSDRRVSPKREQGQPSPTQQQAMDTFNLSQSGQDRNPPAMVSSYWSLSEMTDFPQLLETFGQDWAAIAEHMGSKTPVMVKNFYIRQKDQGKPEWERLVIEAEEKRKRGEKRPEPPNPSTSGRGGRYNTVTPSTLTRPIAVAPGTIDYAAEPTQFRDKSNIVPPPRIHDIPDYGIPIGQPTAQQPQPAAVGPPHPPESVVDAVEQLNFPPWDHGFDPESRIYSEKLTRQKNEHAADPYIRAQDSSGTNQTLADDISPSHPKPVRDLEPHSQLDQLVYEHLDLTSHDHEQVSKSRSDGAEPTGKKDHQARPAVQFDSAIAYVNKIKAHFQHDPQVYKNFLEALQSYQRENKTIEEVYSQIRVLFKTAPALIEEFQAFLP